MPNINGYYVSLLKDTKRVVARSDADWSKIRPASLLKIDGQPHVYEITKTNQFIFNCEFMAEAGKHIIVSKDIGIDLIENDNIYLYYKELELMGMLGVDIPGKSYKEDEVIEVEGGSAVIDIETGKPIKTQFYVRSIDENGGITSIAMKEKGRYLSSPPKKARMNGSHGMGAVLNLEYIVKEDRTRIARSIHLINKDKNVTHIYLDYPLPLGLKNGIISVNKYELFLLQPIVSDNIINGKIEIISDFTTNLKIPLLLPKSMALENIINRSMTIIDTKVNELETRIKKIEDKLSTLP